MSPATGRTNPGTPHKMTMIRRAVIVQKIARRRLDVLPRRLCCVVAVFQVKASSLIGRERCHLQSMGTQVPPRATPQQTSCWDLLPSPPLATIHGGRIQTEELIAFPAPLTSSSACPVLTAPSPLNNTTIIYPLIIGHSTTAPSCIVFVSVKIANSEGLTDKQAYGIYLTNFFQGQHF